MSSLTKCFDAAYPPPVPLMGAQAVLGYIGNHRTDRDVHVWTPEEWQPFAKLRQFPVWELNVSLNARATANQAVQEMLDLGWSHGRALIGAMETYSAPAWWDAFEHEVTDSGMVPVCYGSADTVFGNQAQHYWVAHYDGVPELPPGAWAKQYLSTGAVDWSVLAPELVKHGGEGPRTL